MTVVHLLFILSLCGTQIDAARAAHEIDQPTLPAGRPPERPRTPEVSRTRTADQVLSILRTRLATGMVFEMWRDDAGNRALRSSLSRWNFAETTRWSRAIPIGVWKAKFQDGGMTFELATPGPDRTDSAWISRYYTPPQALSKERISALLSRADTKEFNGTKVGVELPWERSTESCMTQQEFSIQTDREVLIGERLKVRCIAGK